MSGEGSAECMCAASEPPVQGGALLAPVSSAPLRYRGLGCPCSLHLGLRLARTRRSIHEDNWSTDFTSALVSLSQVSLYPLWLCILFS